jgi:hypothetical protein
MWGIYILIHRLSTTYPQADMSKRYELYEGNTLIFSFDGDFASLGRALNEGAVAEESTSFKSAYEKSFSNAIGTYLILSKDALDRGNNEMNHCYSTAIRCLHELNFSLKLKLEVCEDAARVRDMDDIQEEIKGRMRMYYDESNTALSKGHYELFRHFSDQWNALNHLLSWLKGK